MGDSALLIEEIDAGMDFVRRFDSYKPVKAAFWLKIADRGRRYLYVSSDGVDDTNFDLAYGEVIRIADEMRTPYLGPFRVKVIYGTDPKTTAAARMLTAYPGVMPIRSHDLYFGDCQAEELYLYPSLHPAPVA